MYIYICKYVYVYGIYQRLLEPLELYVCVSWPSIAIVKNWSNEFQHSRTSVSDEPRPGTPETATTEDNMIKVHDLVLADRRMKLCERFLRKDTSGHILYEILGMIKLSAGWVPRWVTPDNTQISQIWSQISGIHKVDVYQSAWSRRKLSQRTGLDICSLPGQICRIWLRTAPVIVLSRY